MMLTFKGTAWKVSDVQISNFEELSKKAMAGLGAKSAPIPKQMLAR
jgi:hypothetical protein